MANESTPIIGILACTKVINGGKFQAVYEKYIKAIAVHTNAIPVLITDVGSIERQKKISNLLSSLDGILLTGGPSCVDPMIYGHEAQVDCVRDPIRDGFVFNLLDVATRQDVPILGVCLGAQEMNVFAGGTLYQAIHEETGYLDHRSNQSEKLNERYMPSHRVAIRSGGQIESLLTPSNRTEFFAVNSLHTQGVSKLGKNLQIEAVADDGLVEAFSIEGSSFAIGVQWHMEWMLDEPGINRDILSAFVEHACEKSIVRLRKTSSH